MSTDKEPEESPSESITGLPEAAIAKALQFNVHHNEIKVNEEDIETDDEAEQVDEEATREQELPKAQKQSPVQTSDVTSPQESNVTDVQPISQTKQGFDPTDSRNKQVALSRYTRAMLLMAMLRCNLLQLQASQRTITIIIRGMMALHLRRIPEARASRKKRLQTLY